MGIAKGAGLGFFTGIGVDEVMRQVAIRVPMLQQSTGVPIPGYDPVGIHYDDLLTLVASAGAIAAGYFNKDKEVMALGATMALGSYLASTIFTPAKAPSPPEEVETAGLKRIYVD